MKGPRVGGGAITSASLTAPATIVVLVLLLGATIFLWRARYIRRRSAYLLMLALVLALVALGAWMYANPMQDLTH
jgi:hypothetical protein